MITMQMRSGRLVDVEDLRQDDIDLGDIAYHLASKSRYNGATRYTVAQHCVLASLLVVPGYPAFFDVINQIHAFAHDWHEAYTGDLPSPFKRDERYRHHDRLERKVQRTILDRFSIGYPRYPSEITTVDLRLLATEKRDLLRPCEWKKPPPLPPFESIRIKVWSQAKAEREFLKVAAHFGIE
jgi:hypothetical protein